MAYLGNSPANALFNLSPPITLTAGQTAVYINYTPGRTLFLLNGSVLTLNDDITATNGSTATLTTAATAGDQLVAINFASFSVANALPLGGGTLTGPTSGVTPAQFDNSALLATTGFVQTSLGSNSVGFWNNASISQTINPSAAGSYYNIGTAGTTQTINVTGLGIGSRFTFIANYVSGAVTTIATNGSGNFNSPAVMLQTSFSINAGEIVTVVHTGGGNFLVENCAAGIRLAANMAASLAASGWQKLPSGLIVQWGQSTVSSGTGSFTFPLAFPNNCFSFTATSMGSNGQTSYLVNGGTLTTSGLNVYGTANNAAATFTYKWMAIGN